MKEKFYSDKAIIRYLLGQVSDEEQTDLEQKYFTDPEFSERLSCVEDELIDSYLRQELSLEQRERFETNFLDVPGRRERVAMADALMRCISGPTEHSSVTAGPFHRPGTRPLFRIQSVRLTMAAAALVIVVLLISSWLFLANSRLRGQLDRMGEANAALEIERQRLMQQVADQEAENERLNQEMQHHAKLPEKSVPSPSHSIAAFSLFSGMPRDLNGLEKVVVPAGTRGLRLELVMDAPGRQRYYEASLGKLGGATIWSRSKLKRTDSNSIVVLLPARLLGNGDYLITITATEPGGETVAIGDYAFTVSNE